MAATGYGQMTVTTTAQQLGPAGPDTVLVYNRGTGPIFIGLDVNVTTSTGFQVDPGQSLSLSNVAALSQTVFVIAAASQTMHYIVGGS